MKIKFNKSFKDFIIRFNSDDIVALGTQLAYSFLLAFFPFLIFLMTVLGYSTVKSDEVLAGLREILPIEAYKLIYKTVVEIVETKSIKLLSFGIITTLWTASNGFTAVIKGLNKAYDEDEKRPFWKVQLIALLCTIALVFIIVAAFALLIFGEINGNMLAKYFGMDIEFKVGWNILRYILTLVIMIFIFAALYHFTPCRRLTWREVMPGAIFTTMGWIVCSVLFSLYVNNFNSYSMIYGSIGAVIILMTWMFLISEVLLIGGEINATMTLCKNCK